MADRSAAPERHPVSALTLISRGLLQTVHAHAHTRTMRSHSAFETTSLASFCTYTVLRASRIGFLSAAIGTAMDIDRLLRKSICIGFSFCPTFAFMVFSQSSSIMDLSHVFTFLFQPFLRLFSCSSFVSALGKSGEGYGTNAMARMVHVDDMDTCIYEHLDLIAFAIGF